MKRKQADDVVEDSHEVRQGTGEMRSHEVGGARYAVRAVVRVMDILDMLQASPDGRSLAAISDAAGLPRSSTYRYLATLETRGYVQRDGAGLYRVGLALVPSHGRNLDVLAASARPVMEDLRDRFGETINLGVLAGNRVAYLEILESNKAVRLAARRGDRDPIHSTALGKAIASRMGADAVVAILAAEGMPKRTSKTITEKARYLGELEKVRAQGFALDVGENEEDGRCVAVPFQNGRVLAAISLSAPAARLKVDQMEGIATELMSATRLIQASDGRRQ
jgi:IclR family transcriptional regulator, acetate operon repressor